MKWEKVSLESISTRIGDGLHGTPKYDDNGEFYFINGNNLSEGKILIKEDTKRISSIEYDKIKKDLSERTVLVAINGTLGNVGLYRDEPVALGKSACYINVNDKVEKLFVRYVLENHDFQRYAIDFATGSTIKNLGLKAVRDYSFNLPPLPTQRKIASILSAYDDLIENNMKRIKLLEEKALCEYKLINEFKNTKILGDVLKLNYGKSLSADNRNPGMYPVYGSSGVVGFNELSLVKGPGVIVGRKGNVGTVFWSHSDFFPIDTVYYVESEISLYFLYFNLKHSQHFDNSDAAVPGLNRTSALSNRIHLPSLTDIKAFEDYCKPIFCLMNVLQKQNNKLREARDILLPRLMNGQIEV